MDKGESRQSKTILVLLDWEKAFDKVRHDKLIEALERMGLPPKITTIIKNCYKKASFYTSMDGKSSGWKKQSTGIRQGCPLSPYLFIVLMTVMFHDIHENDKQKMTRQRIKGTQADEVIYADDTICIGQSERAINRLLKTIEEEGAKYGMILNKGKCEMVGCGKLQKIKFGDGSKVNRKYEAKYLGCMLNEKGDASKEIQTRIASCNGTLQKMHMFFRHGDCTERTKMTVFDAVIRSKLMYGLESTALKSSILKQLDAFQMKGIRKIMRLPSSYADREMTNERALKIAHDRINKSHGKQIQIKRLSVLHRERRITTLAKLIKMKEQDPAASVTMDSSFIPHDHGVRRKGRPRIKWLDTTLEDMWEDMKQDNQDIRGSILNLRNPRHRHLLEEEAGNKKYKFNRDTEQT